MGRDWKKWFGRRVAPKLLVISIVSGVGSVASAVYGYFQLKWQVQRLSAKVETYNRNCCDLARRNQQRLDQFFQNSLPDKPMCPTKLPVKEKSHTESDVLRTELNRKREERDT